MRLLLVFILLSVSSLTFAQESLSIKGDTLVKELEEISIQARNLNKLGKRKEALKLLTDNLQNVNLSLIRLTLEIQELEIAHEQTLEKINTLSAEMNDNNQPKKEWACTLKYSHDQYTATAMEEEIAKAKSIQLCGQSYRGSVQNTEKLCLRFGKIECI